MSQNNHLNRRDIVIQELQMLTGVITNDLEYLFYLLIRDGLNKKDDKPKKIVVPYNVSNVEMLDTWFDKLEDCDEE